MDSLLLDAALKDETIFAPLRAAALFPEPPNQVSIDLVRDLMICRRCYQKQEILGGTDAGQNKSMLTIRPYEAVNTKDANYYVTNTPLNMSFLAATAEIKQGPEIFRRISLPDSERIYHKARRDVVTPEGDKNVKIILERNWKDLHQPGVNLSVICENNEISVFANDVPEFARRFWEVYRTDPRLSEPSSGDNLNFGTMFSCIDKITGSGNRAKTIACKKQGQELIDATPIPKLEFTTFRVAHPFEQAMRKSFQDHAFGGCSVLKPGSDPSRICIFKLGTVPYLYIWNELFSTTIRLEEHYRQRQKTAKGYTLTFGGTGNFSVSKQIADYRVELKIDSEKQSDGTERRRLIQLSVLTTVSGLDPTCSPDLMMNQPLTNGPLELTFIENELSAIF
jgi:hypothetical protein